MVEWFFLSVLLANGEKIDNIETLCKLYEGNRE